MNVLVDTSVWVGHFRQHEERLAVLLQAGLVVCHPHVVVEVACGTPPERAQIIGMLSELPSVPVATPGELLTLIERRSLSGRGCGFVDINLLASTLLSTQTMLWTLDKRLDALATEMGRAFRPPLSS